MSDSLFFREEKIPVSIEQELKRSYLDYAMSVIVGRALPDVRDGLKPVHRRILYGMWEQGNTAGKPYKKSARIVGDVMGKYHPHGDAAIYDALVRMAQPFSMRHVLVDGQGNFGSVDGDNPAAMRYTEVRLSRLAEEMLGEDLEKETVDWQPNYDGSLQEPTVLPARFPNLLVNGSSGIAVGMATNIPPHNLGEVIDACVALAKNPEATVDDLLRYLPGPDFPTAAIIRGTDGIRKAYATGQGAVQVQARAVIEHHPKGGKTAIVITELPFQVNKAKLVERIAELVQSKEIDGISDLRDESDRDGIRVVVELKRDAVPQVVLNQLYKLTPMQSSFGINLLAIVEGQPKVLTLKQALEHFLAFRKEVVVRRTRFDLAKAKERAHILEGLVIALDHLDEVIATIRKAPDPPTAKLQLCQRFGLSELQAQAILDLRLQRLTALERDKILAEYQEVLALIERLTAILGSEQLVLEIVIEELLDIKKRFAEPRRTEILPDASELRLEDLIVEEDVVVTVTRAGYIKRSPVSAYRAQRRGGRGRRGALAKDEDPVEHLFVASTHDVLLVFTSRGKVHALKVHEIPDASPASRGKAIVNLLPIPQDERVAALVAVKSFTEDRFLLFATRAGKVKKTELSAFANIRSGGIAAIALEEGDDLLAVRLTDGQSHVFLGTHRGMAIRFHEREVRPMGRVAAGVRGIALRDGDFVEEMATFPENEGGDILVVSEKGFGKRTPVEEFRLQGRGGTGIILMHLTERTGAVAGIRHVHEDDDVLLVTAQGMLIRTRSAEIRRTGRAAQGVRLINVNGDDRVVAVAKLAEREENGGDDEAVH
ncbi:DNA gyrase subunit A [Thermoanaerobaculum aquaticum]|jgi:DNA gyrase subunit A|uniref:DNA gyrase subunit A n=2 Tax=Thermoanaerobaculum aquaticum TaxID=1312852 RepID=A0A062XQN8_9BACT|nr:DNA gyrase subunit A [Thermoanaerobaculum aquaticum]KDA54882.1 DNA gyrase subunit A [Thermoanaerobaculum aquaticum]GBC80220.1 DNA gyrase subunit A [bacterium HR09]